MDLKTGDLLLIRSHSKKTIWKLFEYAIKLGTGGSYTHCGIVVQNPKTSRNSCKHKNRASKGKLG